MKSSVFNINRYINNVTSLQFFQLFRFVVLFLISIVFTKTDLGTGEIGVYETFILIAGGVSFFWIGGFLHSMLSVFNNNETFSGNKTNPIFFNIFLLFCLLSFFAALFVYSTQEIIANFLSLSSDKIPYMKILFMYICVSGPVNMIEYIYLLKNKSKHIIFYGVISFVLQFLCVTTPVILGYDLGYGLYGLVFINGLRFLWLLNLLYKHSEFKISFLFIKEYLKLSHPLIVSLLLAGSATYIDGFLVSYKFDEATFAIFRYGARELPFVILLANAFSSAMVPAFSNYEKIPEALKKLKTGSEKLMMILFPLSIVFVLISKSIFPIIFNPDFYDSAIVFNIYILLIISRILFPQTILIGMKKTNIVMTASAVEITINVALSIIFINIWGIAGVAFATVIAFISDKVILASYLKIKMNIGPEEYLNLKKYSVFTILVLTAFIVSLFL